MAFYAEMVRRKWHCVNGCDMIRWYKKYRYEMWYASLSEEERVAYHDRLKRDRERAEREARNAIMGLLSMATMCSSLTGDKYFT